MENGYFSSVGHLVELASQGTADLMLMGIEPTYPSAKYGYVMPADAGEASRVSSFKEKPDERRAAEYIAAGALWNSGVFAYRLGYVLKKARELLGFRSYEDLFANYQDFKKISFDYAVVEQERNIGVLRYQGEWKDLGTWNTLTEVMDEKGFGEAVLADCHNVHAVNELGIPLLCMGMRDVVVAASPNGILVSDKHASSYIKPHVERLPDLVMFAEKSWGEFRIIDVEPGSLTIKVLLNPGHGMSYHSHEHRDEVWTIVEGEGEILLDGTARTVKAGEVIEIPRGMKHTLKAITQLRVIEVQIGEDISVEDKIKFS